VERAGCQVLPIADSATENTPEALSNCFRTGSEHTLNLL
jgi:hypothetical protein